MNRVFLIVALLASFSWLMPNQSRADFVIEFVNTTPMAVVEQQVIYNINLKFDVDPTGYVTPPLNVNFISFNLDLTTAPPLQSALPNLFDRFTTQDSHWQGGIDSETGLVSFQAAAGNEIAPVVGAFNFTLGKLLIDSTNLTVNTFHIGSVDWVIEGEATGGGLFDFTELLDTDRFYPVHPDGNDAFVFTITAVPEPSSLALVVVITCFGCFARSRRICTSE